jgi:hypothetical protein
MSWYWLIVVVAILVVLYPFQGGITWLVHQQRREGRFAVVAPPRRPTPSGRVPAVGETSLGKARAAGYSPAQ